MDKQNLNIFLKFLEESGSDMNNINSFLNNLQNNNIKCEEVTNIINKIKQIINASTFNNEYFDMNENFYKYLLNTH